LLFDRIQVYVLPRYTNTYDVETKELKEEYKKNKDLIIENKKLNNLKYRTYRDGKNKFHYDILMPLDEKRPYILDIKISPFSPFIVSFKINFIRLIRDKLKEDVRFRKEYDKLVLLDEDNFLNYENWPYWDNSIVSELINGLNELCIEIADESLFRLMPYHLIKYDKVMVSQIETNINFYVGCNNSLYTINQYPNFIESADGKEFRRNLGEIALKHKAPATDYDKSTKRIKNDSHSIQFQISKGLSFKVYRKTRDHIRAELLFEKSYLQRKFKEKYIELGRLKTKTGTDIKRIVKPVLEFSKSFFKDANLENVFYNMLSSGNHEIVISELQPVYDFFRTTIPEINDIIDCVKNGFPITDKTTIRYIRKNRVLLGNFVSEYDSNGNKVYIYDPIKANKRKEELLKKRRNKELIETIDQKRHRSLVGNKRRLWSWEKNHYDKERYNGNKDDWKRPIPYYFKNLK
jgi:hypothetical protein